MQRVLQVLRAPVGGLFRHVRDLVQAQAAMGLQVGVICDSNAADRLTCERLAALEPHLALGLHLVPMARAVGLGDLAAYRKVLDVAASTGAGVLHGHGAKGGAYARLAAATLRRRGFTVHGFYTPHGGSLNFATTSVKGRIYMSLERQLGRITSGVIFESAWSEQAYRRQVGSPACAVRVIPNGLVRADFEEHRPAPEAYDIAFVGELRAIKGIDVLIEAVAAVRTRRPVRALIVGDGPDGEALRARAQALGIGSAIDFPGAMPARAAFAQARLLAIPSRAESFPYIVLEAAAAGIPLITTHVGGIPEIVAGTDTDLIPADDVAALAAALSAAIENPEAAEAKARRLRDAMQARFTVERMAGDIVGFYESVAAATVDNTSLALA